MEVWTLWLIAVDACTCTVMVDMSDVLATTVVRLLHKAIVAVRTP